jgi:hypothetical protein
VGNFDGIGQHIVLFFMLRKVLMNYTGSVETSPCGDTLVVVTIT